MASSPITTWKLEGEKVELVTDFFFFLGIKVTVDSECSQEIIRQLLLGRKAITNLDCVGKHTHYSTDKGQYSRDYGLPSGHAQLWKLDRKGRKPKNWCVQTVVLEKTPESPLDNKEIKPVNLKGDQTWIFTGRTDTEAEGPVVDENGWLIEKIPDAGKDWGQKEKRASEDERAGCQHQWNEHELGQTLGDGEGQGDLERCSPWGQKESDTTGQLHNNNASAIFLSVRLIICKIWILCMVWGFYGISMFLFKSLSPQNIWLPGFDLSLGQGAELYTSTTLSKASMVAKMVKNPPEMQET